MKSDVSCDSFLMAFDGIFWAGKEGFKLWVLGKEAGVTGMIRNFVLEASELSAASHGPKAGKVIGRGGETVREIMQRTGAEIQVSSGCAAWMKLQINST